MDQKVKLEERMKLILYEIETPTLKIHKKTQRKEGQKYQAKVK